MPRRLRELLLAAVLALGALPAVAAEAVLRHRVEEPRAFGHTLGDLLQRRLTLEVAAPWVLDETALPKAGRIGLWLEQRAPLVQSGRSGGLVRYTLDFGYQLINSPREVTTLLLPEITLQFSSEAGASAFVLPEAPFTAGPLTPETILARGPLEEMQPDIAPWPLDTAGMGARLAGYGVVAATLLAWLGYRLWGVPWLARSRGPFARALPDLKRLAHGGAEAAPRALKRLHRAFDETAGRAVFAEQQGAFLAAHPRFAPQAEAIARFFELSRQTFFVGAPVTGDPLPWLLQLCRDCRAIERGLA